MPEILLTVPHALPVPEAVTRLKRMAEDLVTRSPYLQAATVTWPSDTEGRIQGSELSGTLTVRPAEVSASIRVEGMLAMFRPMVEDKLRELLTQTLTES